MWNSSWVFGILKPELAAHTVLGGSLVIQVFIVKANFNSLDNHLHKFFLSFFLS